MNSIVLGLSSSLAAAVIGTLGAVGFTKIQARTKNVVEYISMLPIMTPEIILGMVFMAFFSLLGLPFGMTTLILAHTAFCIPYIYMLVKARLVGLDKSLPEAARDLGASEARVFFDITLPLIAPAIASGMLLSFAMSFDDVIISLFVTGVNVNTLPIKVYTSLKTGVTPEINALCTLMLAFTVAGGGRFRPGGAQKKLRYRGAHRPQLVCAGISRAAAQPGPAFIHHTRALGGLVRPRQANRRKRYEENFFPGRAACALCWPFFAGCGGTQAAPK